MASTMRHFKVQIPEDQEGNGFPIEWISITDEGSVLIHFGTPVLLQQVTLDGNPIINISTGLSYLIGTGQTVEVQMTLTRSPEDDEIEANPYNTKADATNEHNWKLAQALARQIPGQNKVQRLLARMKKKLG